MKNIYTKILILLILLFGAVYSVSALTTRTIVFENNNYGMGTTSPTSTFVIQGTTNHLVRVATSTDYSIFAIDENGDVTISNDVEINGDLDFTDSGSGLIYGGMGQHDGVTTVTITAANTFATTTGMSGSLFNNVTFQNSQELLIAVDGVYNINWDLSYELNGSNEEIEGAVGINGVAQLTFATAHRHISSANDIGAMGPGNFFALTAGDVISLMVTNETNTSDVIVDHANLTIWKIGN